MKTKTKVKAGEGGKVQTQISNPGLPAGTAAQTTNYP
jgi:hypothetical protein